jgi:hypothetical protein
MDHQAFAQLLGNYGEFVGSLAILITLVYLSIQVRQARAQQQVNDRQTREFAIRDYHLNLANSDGLATALARAREAVGEEPRGFVQNLVEQGIAHEDAIRVFAFYVADFRICSNTYYTSRDDQQRQANDSKIQFAYGDTKLGALFWEHYSKAGSAHASMAETLGPFGSHVERLLDAREARADSNE